MKTAHLLLFTTLAIVPAGMNLGCNDVHAPIEGRYDPYDAHQVHYTGERLANVTAAREAILSRDPNGYLHVTVPVRSAIDRDVRVDYQTQFFDSTGVAIYTTAWQSATLPANTPTQVSAVCDSPAAVNFQMTFRPAQ